jgi:hypothetical protein
MTINKSSNREKILLIDSDDDNSDRNSQKIPDISGIYC